MGACLRRWGGVYGDMFAVEGVEGVEGGRFKEWGESIVEWRGITRPGSRGTAATGRRDSGTAETRGAGRPQTADRS